MPTTTPLPSLADQLARLRDLGIEAAPPSGEGLVVVHPELLAPGRLVELVRHGDKPGFVVDDLGDLDEFVPIEGESVPERPLYLVQDPQRGDEMANWSPDEALPAIRAAGRRPMTINEGLSWLLQQPEQLERNHCFMTIASRKPSPRGLDARTPAIWISNGTGRDGRERRHAPKLGWCWAGNRHTWLGFGSVGARG